MQEKNIYCIFKNISDYNDSFFEIRKGDVVCGYYGNGVLLIFVNKLDYEELKWLCRNIVDRKFIEYGFNYYLDGFPVLKLIGGREKKMFIRHYSNYLVKMSKYYELTINSKELADTLPFKWDMEEANVR